MKVIIEGYGTVEFDPMNFSNNFYDLYAVAVVDPEDEWKIATEEHYTDEGEYHSALRNTCGREVYDEQALMGFCDIIDGCGDLYECECTYHVAYVTDTDEE